MKLRDHVRALEARLPGHTLIELAAVLAAVGIALAIAAPILSGTLDGLAVRAARDATVAELARARLLARLHGGAMVVLDATGGAVWIEAEGDTLGTPIDLSGQYHASLDLSGDSRAVIVYDRLGLGRLANRTIRLVRGDADARLTVSAYGRVRAW
ncbi:MAG: pilus assembly FimT family protein [Longimicrobiales bacterium]